MQFDEKFLQEMGLSAMPEQEKQKFLDYIQEVGGKEKWLEIISNKTIKEK